MCTVPPPTYKIVRPSPLKMVLGREGLYFGPGRESGEQGGGGARPPAAVPPPLHYKIPLEILDPPNSKSVQGHSRASRIVDPWE